MAIGSGTYTFRMNAGQIVQSALRKTGNYDAAQVPAQTDPDFINTMEALNVICKDLAIEGGPLWCIEDVAFPTVIGQMQYNLSTIMGMPLPPRILDAYIRDLSLPNAEDGGNDVQLIIISRYDYNTLGQKFARGVPNQIWYNPQLEGGILTLYDVPADNRHEIHVVAQRQIQDLNIPTDNPDFPQEAARMLIWCLLDEISLEMRMPPDERKEANQRAVDLKQRFFDSPWSVEQSSTFFTPTERTM